MLLTLTPAVSNLSSSGTLTITNHTSGRRTKTAIRAKKRQRRSMRACAWSKLATSIKCNRLSRSGMLDAEGLRVKEAAIRQR